MRKHVSKILSSSLIVLALYCASSYVAKPVHAGAHPRMYGYVRNANTNAPIPNVWVRWRIGQCGTVCHCPGMNKTEEAYVLTDATGRFYFREMYAEWPTDINALGRMIDTNFDGTNDDEQIPRYTGPDCYRAPGFGKVITWNFGCSENTHTFTAIVPNGWNGNFSTASNDMNNIAGEVNVGTIYYTPVTPTPTPRPNTPSPTPTRTATPRPSASPTRTPTPTPGIPNCVGTGTCSDTEAGKRTALGNLATTGIVVNDSDVYAKLTIHPYNTSSLGARLYFSLNESYFSYDNPLSTTETYRMNTDGSNRTAISPGGRYVLQYQSGSPNKLYIELPSFAVGTKYEVYIKINPTQTTGAGGQPVAFNGTYPTTNFVQYASTITYGSWSTTRRENISNTNLVIESAPTPAPSGTGNFFQALSGDVFSRGTFSTSVNNTLPASEPFIADNSGMLLTASANQFGRSTSSVVDYYDESYNVTNPLSYDTLYNTYLNSIIRQDLSTGDGSLANGEYLHTNGANIDLDIGSGSKFRRINAGEKFIVFVEGNLYIGPISPSDRIEIDNDGKTLVTFIVKGNIGIHPSVNRIDGIYITDGVIDTVCDKNVSNFSGTECGPATTSSSNSLEINGMTFAAQGYKLQRNNTSGSAAEIFNLRPDFFISGSELLAPKNVTWYEFSN